MNESALVLFGLGWQAWYTLGVVALMLVLLVREVARPVIVLPGCLGLLLVVGVLPPEAAFAGFSNSAVLTIAALYVVAAGVQRTEALGFLDRVLFSTSSRIGVVLTRLMGTTAFLSTFLNNTPLVSMLVPRIERWAAERGIPASKLLMPLSFAAVLGGMVTIIGTSTNLLVVGLMESSGLEPLGMFDLAWVGVPAAAAGVLYMASFGHRLLPQRAQQAPVLEDNLAEYLFELKVGPGSVLAGRTVEEAGLRALEAGYLVHIRRENHLIETAPDAVLREEDELAFLGSPAVMDRLLQVPGIEPVVASMNGAGREQTLPLYEAVVAPSSRLVGRTLREVSFRDRYHGVVLAVQRSDERIAGPLGRTPLRAGDLLLVEAANGFDKRWNARRDEFYLVAPRRRELAKPLSDKAPISLVILGAMVVVGALEIIPLVVAAFAAAIGMIVAGCLKEEEARRALDLPVLIVLAAALGIGRAVEASGLAEAGANLLLGSTAGLGPMAVLAATYLTTNILTEVITNNAAAVLMLPLGLAAAVETGIAPEAFAVAVAIAASAGFMTPIGYQTHLMVMSPGGYRFTDFARVGLGLNLLVMIIAVVVISLVWT